MKIEKSEEKIDVVIVGKEELQEGVAATGTAVEELEYLLENCGFINPNRWNLFQTFMQEMQVIQGEIDNLFLNFHFERKSAVIMATDST